MGGGVDEGSPPRGVGGVVRSLLHPPPPLSWACREGERGERALEPRHDGARDEVGVVVGEENVERGAAFRAMIARRQRRGDR